MRSGGSVRKATIAGLTMFMASCSSRNAPPKTTELTHREPSVVLAGGTGGKAGARSETASEDSAVAYRDPSKLLESDNSPSVTTATRPGRPSNSGLSLEVSERGPSQPWSVRIVNRGDEAAELVADTRLLWFEVSVPSKKKSSVCKLPEPLSPGNLAEHRLVVHLEPGEGVEDQFDPRLYCFAEGDQKLLIPGAEVTPHFGWAEAPPKKRWKHGKRVEEPVLQKPPFVARKSLEPPKGNAQNKSLLATPAAAARLTSAGVTDADKQLEGAKVTLESDYVEWSGLGAGSRHDNSSGQNTAGQQGEGALLPSPTPRLAIRLVQGSDAKAEHDATVQLTISNQSPLPTHVYFRREMVSYEVAGPSGILQCPGRLDDRAPEKEAFLRLARNGKRNYSTRLAELCPRGTFAIPGLYLVYARFDATHDGRDQGLDAFIGQIYSRTPATVRIRTGEQAIFQKRPMQRIAANGDAQANLPGAQ